MRKIVRRQGGGYLPELTAVTKAIPEWARTPTDRAYLDQSNRSAQPMGKGSAETQSSGKSDTESKARGGVVKKPIKRYQRGGVVTGDTAPGAASASSHKWSANIKGRDVTMKAKGGKITNLKKGRK